PSAVSGLTKHDAPSAGVAPGNSTRHWSAFTQRYCEYIAPPIAATVLPTSACACGDDPALTATPAPSLPTGLALSTPPAGPFTRASGMRAVTTGFLVDPDCFRVLVSAAANISPRSDGLIGEASTRMTTSSACGEGVSISTSESSSSPLCFTRERS